MAQLGYDFDPDTAPKDERNFDPMPDGWYAAQVIESDVAPTKAGDGLRMTLTWEVTEGPFARRRVWQGLNIQNKSAQAQEMAQRDLRTICEAVGHAGKLQDSRDLEFKPCVIRVGRQRDDREKNEWKSARPMGGSAPAQQAQPSQQNQAHQQQSEPQRQAASGGGSRPWNRAR